ncbi:hypothetical protein GCM10027601_02590 [Nocardioides ungokensis]
MSRESGLEFLCMDEFLVCYDYGSGGLWGILTAPSEDAVRAKYPELTIAEVRPPWMDDEHIGQLYAEPLRLDDPPTGLLAALVADRERT